MQKCCIDTFLKKHKTVQINERFCNILYAAVFKQARNNQIQCVLRKNSVSDILSITILGIMLRTVFLTGIKTVFIITTAMNGAILQTVRSTLTIQDCLIITVLGTILKMVSLIGIITALQITTAHITA